MFSDVTNQQNRVSMAVMNSFSYPEKATDKRLSTATAVEREALVEQRIASEWIVNDRIFATPSPTLAMTVCRHLVWVAYGDGHIEVRNARTSEIVKRFLCTAPEVAEDKSNPNTADVSFATVPKSEEHFSFFSLKKNVEPPKPKKNKNITPEQRFVKTMITTETSEGDPFVWLGMSNGAIEIFHGEKCYFVRTLRRHSGAVNCLAEFGGLLYSAGNDGVVVQWGVEEGRYLKTFSADMGHEGPIWCLYAEGNAVVTGSVDNTVKVWDIGTAKMELTGYFHSLSGGVSALCRVGELMWSGDNKGQLVRWTLRTCEAVQIHQPHSAKITILHKVGSRVYSGSADGTVALHCAASGSLLQRLQDHSTGWVSAFAAPVQLTRFVLWSAGSDGLVRCWYQDEYIPMNSDHERLNDASWYRSGSTPYREFRAALGQYNEELRNKIALAEGKDAQASQVLRRCSVAFTGGKGKDQIGQHLNRVKDQMSLAQQRKNKMDQDITVKKSELDQLDLDINSTKEMLETAQRELQQLEQQGYGQWGAMGMTTSLPPPPPGPGGEWNNPYGTTTNPLLAMYGNQSSTIPLAGSTLSPGETPPEGGAFNPLGGLPPPPLPPPPPPPGGNPYSPIAAPPNSAQSLVDPQQPPLPAAPSTGPILPLPDVVASPTAYAGTPGGLPPPPPPPPQPTSPYAPLGDTNTTNNIASPFAGMASPTALNSTSAGMTGLGLTSPMAPGCPLSPTPGLGTSLPSPGGVASPIGIGAPLLSPVGGAGLGTDPLTGGPIGGAPSPTVLPDGTLAPPPPLPTDAAATTAAEEAEKKKKEKEKLEVGVKWVNPNVGHYILRRYYGAYPSLRTTDIQKREAQRRRSPRVKVEPFDRVKMKQAAEKRKEEKKKKMEEEHKKQIEGKKKKGEVKSTLEKKGKEEEKIEIKSTFTAAKPDDAPSTPKSPVIKRRFSS